MTPMEAAIAARAKGENPMLAFAKAEGQKAKLPVPDVTMAGLGGKGGRGGRRRRATPDPSKARDHVPKQWLEMLEMYENSHTQKELAKHFKISEGKVCNRLRHARNFKAAHGENPTGG